MQKTTDFGYRTVPIGEKEDLVQDVFDKVAEGYDRTNDAMSLGIHRFWKYYTASVSGLRENDWALDIAGGTGDLAAHFAHSVGKEGHVVLADLNVNMLKLGRDKLVNNGIVQASYTQTNAELLPFKNESFHLVASGFGLRNFSNKHKALCEMHRVLKPGGKLLILEFSTPNKALKKVYDFYSFNCLPKIGAVLGNDEESYQYLAESIRKHPDQTTLKKMILDARFASCEYHNLSGGIVALHKAIKD